MAFTSSIQISKGSVLEPGGDFRPYLHRRHPHEWAHVIFIFVGLITLLICIHGLCALRLPSSYHQCRDMKNHTSA